MASQLELLVREVSHREQQNKQQVSEALDHLKAAFELLSGASIESAPASELLKSKKRERRDFIGAILTLYNEKKVDALSPKEMALQLQKNFPNLKNLRERLERIIWMEINSKDSPRLTKVGPGQYLPTALLKSWKQQGHKVA